MKNTKHLSYRVLIIAIVIIAPMEALFAQTVTVADLMPLSVGQYVEYNQYDTATGGATPTKSFGYYEVQQNGLSFQGANNVFLANDVLGSGDPTGTHSLHYSFTAAGDLQVFADTALLADILPSSLTPGIKNPPNRWIDQYKMSAGSNVYQIDTVNTTYTSQGQTATVKIIFSGKYVGMENIIVAGTNYPTAYRFELIANLTITDFTTLGTLTLTESDWLVKGIGIVKTSLPLDSTKLKLVNTEVSAGGRAKEMAAFGVAGASSVAPAKAQTSTIRFYPDPASDQITVSFDHPASHIFLYNDAGQMVRSFELSSHSTEALLWVGNIPNGAYHAQVVFADGTEEGQHMVVHR